VLRLAASDPTTTFTNVGLVVTFLTSVVYAENFHGGFIQWHMVVIYIYGTVFVTSQLYRPGRWNTGHLASLVQSRSSQNSLQSWYSPIQSWSVLISAI